MFIGKTVFLSLLLAMCAVSAPGQTASSTGRVLPVPYRPQHSNNWCWAASANMIMRHWHARDSTAPVMTQCEQAVALCSSFKGWKPIPVSCPMDLPPPDSLNQGWAPFSVGDKYTKSTSSTPLVWDSVKYQIDHNMPFAVEWGYEGVTDSTSGVTGNHWVVFTGYQMSQYSTEPYVSYSDPWSADSAIYKVIPFSEYATPNLPAFVNHPGIRFTKHVATYYNIMPMKQ